MLETKIACPPLSVSTVRLPTESVVACDHLRLVGPFGWLERHEGWAPLDYALLPGSPDRWQRRLLDRVRRPAVRRAAPSAAPAAPAAAPNATPRFPSARGVWSRGMLATARGDTRFAPVPQADALLLYRETIPWHAQMPLLVEQAFQWARQRGIPVVYDTDDLLTGLPADSPHAGIYQVLRPFLTRWIRNADHVTVANQAMADELAEINPSISILPSFMDVDLWGVTDIPDADDRPVSVGYWGSPWHLPDLQGLVAAFRHLKQKYGRRVRFQFLGCQVPELLALEDASGGPYLESYAHYAHITRDCPLDIALAPLADNRFNRCKSAIKFFEYSIRGACGVYADLTPYQQVVRSGENGVLVGPALEEWVGALEQLIEAPERRVRLARQAQADVLHHHTLEKQSVHWRNAYQLAVAPFARPRESVAVMA
jgi:glycosyltransferase involved in cell wall biosynthesis